jgi:putative FmdB family regulatory protein
MPIYEYRCNGCERTYEVLQRLADPPLDECPGCGVSGLEKLFSVAAVLVREGGTSSAGSASGAESPPYLPRPTVRALPGGGPFTVDATLPPDFRHPSIGAFRAYRSEE